jgi:hypothetical protein
MMKVDWKQRAKTWRERAKKAERVAKAASEAEYAYHATGLTYTNTTAVRMARNRLERGMEELQWVLRNEGGLKR